MSDDRPTRHMEEEKGTGYFSGDVRGRPRGRSVESRPKVAAIVACQLAVPFSFPHKTSGL